jgi:hypothetical protein
MVERTYGHAGEGDGDVIRNFETSARTVVLKLLETAGFLSSIYSHLGCGGAQCDSVFCFVIAKYSVSLVSFGGALCHTLRADTPKVRRRALSSVFRMHHDLKFSNNAQRRKLQNGDVIHGVASTCIITEIQYLVLPAVLDVE